MAGQFQAHLLVAGAAWRSRRWLFTLDKGFSVTSASILPASPPHPVVSPQTNWGKARCAALSRAPTGDR